MAGSNVGKRGLVGLLADPNVSRYHAEFKPAAAEGEFEAGEGAPG